MAKAERHHVRPAAVAGLFYPDDPDELAGLVDRLLAGAAPPALGPPPKAIIAPHAGYEYSGPIAASAYALLAAARGRVRRVLLFGPAHCEWFRGLAAPTVAAFATPLGAVPLDRTALAGLADLPQVVPADSPHREDHALEVQLPFLVRVLGDFALVPLLVGEASPAEVTAVMARLWGGEETLVVVSSDLSHYLDYRAACRRDAATAGAIERGAGDALGPHDACGYLPVAGLLGEAGKRGLAARRLDLRNSGDTAGPRDRVVGYGAWALGA
jgi:hypothetical protein